MKRKVLFLIESLAGGGAEKVLTTLVQNIDKEKFDVTVCAISGGGKYEQQVKEFCNYKALLSAPKSNSPLTKICYIIRHHLIYRWLPLSWVYRLLVPQGNDVEVAYVEGFATKLLAHSSNRNSKKIAWVHIDLHNFHWTKDVYRDAQEETWCYNQYSKIIGVAETVITAFKQEFPQVFTSTGTIYNPIDSGNILQQSKSLEFTPKYDSIRIVSTGRLNPQKAYDRLLRIVKRLKEEKHNVELWLLGDGVDREKLEDYSQDNNLTNEVRLLGFQTNPYQYLSQCDLFVCSSISEGYSTAVTEALILGLPVVTTDCSGMKELLKDGECGIITENSEEALYVGIKSLFNNPTLLSHYSRKAVERGKDFSLPQLMKSIEAELW